MCKGGLGKRARFGGNRVGLGTVIVKCEEDRKYMMVKDIRNESANECRYNIIELG